MTVRLTAGSARRIGAARFAAVIRRAMKANSVGATRLGPAAGISAAAISGYRAGHNIPTLEVASRLADILNEPLLLSIAREAREVACENCGTLVVIEAGTPRRYCGEDCMRLAYAKRSGKGVRERAVTAERTARVYRDSVAAMCATCEPEGLCRTPECPLRAVSPLSLAPYEQKDVLAIRPRRTIGNDPILLAKSLAANARRWTPEERKVQSRRTTAMHASMSPEERLAFAAKVSAGRRGAA